MIEENPTFQPSGIAGSVFYCDHNGTHTLFPLPSLTPTLIALFIPYGWETAGCVPASKRKWENLSSTAPILFCSFVCSTCDASCPSPACPSTMGDGSNAFYLCDSFTRFLGAAAKTQTAKEHDMNRFFKETIDIFSSNTSAFILLLEQLLNSCGVY